MQSDTPSSSKTVFTPKRRLEIKGFVDHFNHNFMETIDKITPKVQTPKDIIFKEELRSMFELMVDKK